LPRSSAGVTHCVKADAGQPGAVRGRHQHAPTKRSRIRRPTVTTGEDVCVVGHADWAQRMQRGGELRMQGHEALAVARFRRSDDAPDDRAAYVQPRRLALEVQVTPAQRDRLRDPQTGRAEQFEQGPPPRRASSSSRASSSRVRTRRSFTSHARPARRRGSTAAPNGLVSSKPSATAASSARRSGVITLAIERSRSRPSRPG
jgi:hypothetical protein